MSLLNLFYSYGFVWVIYSIYNRFFQKEFLPANTDLFSEKSRNAIANKLTAFERTIGIFNFIWLIMGIFTPNRWYFTFIASMMIVAGIICSKMDRKTAKNLWILSDFFNWVVILKMLTDIYLPIINP